MAVQTPSGPLTAGLIAAGALLTSVVLLFAIKRGRRKPYVLNVGRVSKLIIYPIKGLPGIEVQEVEVTPNGAKYGNFADRCYALLDHDGRMITMRQQPRLALIKVTITGEKELTFESPGCENLKITLRDEAKESDTVLQFKIWGTATQGVVLEDEVSRWFENFLQEPGVMLVQHVPSLQMRPTSVEKNNRVQEDMNTKIRYQDGCPLLVINANSIAELNSGLSDSMKPTDHRNWRPNILICDMKPYAEDTWSHCRINGIEFEATKACDRCAVPSIDPDTAVKDDKLREEYQKLRAPTTERQKKIYGANALFGMNVKPLRSGFITVNDVLDGQDK